MFRFPLAVAFYYKTKGFPHAMKMAQDFATAPVTATQAASYVNDAIAYSRIIMRDVVEGNKSDRL